jgi:hypothetical protein
VTVGVEPAIAPSARRHGVGDEDIRHAYANPIRIFELEDGLLMLVGANAAGALLEIGVVAAQGAPLVVHAMAARKRFLR